MKGERKEAMERELLKWVAEELLGWRFVTGYWYPPKTEDHGFSPFALEAHLESWHGIGLVVEAMAKRDLYMDLDSGAKPGGIVAVNWRVAFWNAEMKSMMDISVWGPWDDPNDEEMYIMDEKPWIAVYEAARKAVRETKS